MSQAMDCADNKPKPWLIYSWRNKTKQQARINNRTDTWQGNYAPMQQLRRKELIIGELCTHAVLFN